MEVNIRLNTAEENPIYVKELLGTLANYQAPGSSDPAATKKPRNANRAASDAPVPAVSPAPQPATSSEEPQEVAAAPVSQETVSNPAPTENKKLTIADCKAAMFPKLDNHRETIANILKDYNAESISKLDAKHYPDFIARVTAL